MKTIKKIIKSILFFFHLKRNVNIGNKGERVDIILRQGFKYEGLDTVKLSHIKRYEYASSLVNIEDDCADFACGSGYGTIMLSRKANSVIGIDLNKDVIIEIKKRYSRIDNVDFMCLDLLNMKFHERFNKIISFETIEHINETEIPLLLMNFHRSLKESGILVFSTPFMQEKSEIAIKMGFHLTFYIDEKKICHWLRDSGFNLLYFLFQNYSTHEISNDLNWKDFIICVAQKK
jgi:2-polyprenyl-3-methyl-5-hydroxy-6-metoxy-1,4-benzoquinol methylase